MLKGVFLSKVKAIEKYFSPNFCGKLHFCFEFKEKTFRSFCFNLKDKNWLVFGKEQLHRFINVRYLDNICEKLRHLKREAPDIKACQ